ncbi:hypothetical protein CHS0354_041048 [Potamilus streckersoni]|uniref:WD repeat-containing protein 54 beta-propeller domain-containing protein n=1 Tax=Potamilus streckersoni TaxID=2493646 RepID=A0AAE0VTG9_9BIVA|nr:hypothetical protein CHS0354_041048 [Potamilus streckersoni]
MYRRDKPIAFKSSVSLLVNNLTCYINLEKGSLNYAAVHRYLVNIVSSTPDGSQVTHKQIMCKEPSATQQGTSMIIQVKWVTLPARVVLVITSIKGIQMFEYDGSAMLYWHALKDHAENADQCNFGRGIAGVGENLICIGSETGEIMVFSIPSKGPNVALKETLKGHKSAICDLTSDHNNLYSSDDEGNIIMWTLQGSQIQQTGKIPGSGDPVSSIEVWKSIIVASYGNGQIKAYSAKTGKVGAVVNAHARWINAVSVAKGTGLVLTASEDSFVKVWQLNEGPTPELEFKFAECVTDLQLVGAQFVDENGKAFAVTGYDSPDLIFFSHS